MFRRYRQRRGPYALAEPSPAPRLLGRIVVLLVVAFVFYKTAGWVVGLFGGWSDLQRKAVALEIQGRGPVNVALEGGLLKRTEDNVPLYAGDKVATGAGGRASLTFFDGSTLRLDEESELDIVESSKGEEDARLELTLVRGTVWMNAASASGTITRTIRTPRFTVEIPGNAEFVAATSALSVFAADGEGLPVTPKSGGSIVIGEGQKLTLPEEVGSNLFSYRAALVPGDYEDSFLVESLAQVTRTAATGSGASASTDILTVTAPLDDATVNGTTVTVQGRVGRNVTRVRVNGYQAQLNPATGSFSQELAFDSNATLDIRVQALDQEGLVLGEASRTVKHGQQTSTASPTITAPAKTGETYRTTAAELVLRGTVPAGTLAVVVNEYQLQLFSPEKGTWSYLASIALGNMKSGINTYDVYAVDAQGKRSAPARITIAWGEDTQLPTGSTGSAASAPAVKDETTLPKNAPLTPGSLKVTGPTEGTAHTSTGAELVIQGTTSAETASVWVNGYQLQLYKAGKTTWNYIASADLLTLKRGTNTYRVVARNAKDEILDQVEYVITY